MVCLCRGCCITTPSTNTQNTNLLRVDSVEILKVVDDSVDVADTLIEVLEEVGFASTSTLVGCIIDNCCKPSTRQFLSLGLGGLFLDTTARMNNDQSGRCLRSWVGGFEEEARQGDGALFDGNLGHGVECRWDGKIV